MIFQLIGDADQLIIDFRKSLLDLINLHRCTDTGDNVLALCVHKNFREELVLARSRVTCEGNARSGIIAHVAECHHLDIDSCAPAVGDIIVTTIDVRARVVPGTEDSLDCLDELYLRVCREIIADLSLVLSLELACEFLQIVRTVLQVPSDRLL